MILVKKLATLLVLILLATQAFAQVRLGNSDEIPIRISVNLASGKVASIPIRNLGADKLIILFRATFISQPQASKVEFRIVDAESDVNNLGHLNQAFFQVKAAQLSQYSETASGNLIIENKGPSTVLGYVAIPAEHDARRRKIFVIQPTPKTVLVGTRIDVVAKSQGAELMEVRAIMGRGRLGPRVRAEKVDDRFYMFNVPVPAGRTTLQLTAMRDNATTIELIPVEVVRSSSDLMRLPARRVVVDLKNPVPLVIQDGALFVKDRVETFIVEFVQPPSAELLSSTHPNARFLEQNSPTQFLAETKREFAAQLTQQGSVHRFWPSDRLSRSVRSHDFDAHTAIGADRFRFDVIFFPQVKKAKALRILREIDVERVEGPGMTHNWTVEGSRKQMLKFAAYKAVRLVDESSPPATDAGGLEPLSALPTGFGIKVGQWEVKGANPSEPELSTAFTSRVQLFPATDVDTANEHATEVAIIFAGKSQGAGAATIWGDSTERTSDESQAQADARVEHKLNLTNNSWRYIDGEATFNKYDRTSLGFDTLVHGRTPLPVLFAAGSPDWTPDETTLWAPGATAKNTIVVGSAIENFSFSTFVSSKSGCGPAPGGRLKPDFVMAGGSSSFACALATRLAIGIIKFWQTKHASEGLLPSTLRALFIQETQDGSRWPSNVINQGLFCETTPTGPDHFTGFGYLDLDAGDRARLSISEQRVFQDEVTPSKDTKIFELPDFDTSDGKLRVTLAWDDPPAGSIGQHPNPQLLNDLDLVVISPDGTHYYPWIPGTSLASVASPGAVRPDATEDLCLNDHHNNCEQVELELDSNQGWKVRVKLHRASAIAAKAGQKFSLVWGTL